MTPGAPPADAGRTDRLNPFVTVDGAEGATGAAWASTTRSTYATQWSRFRVWCEERQLAPLDASPEQVAVYLHERAERGKLSTVKLSAAAISAGYRAAGRLDPTMKRVIAEARRGIEQQKKADPGWAPRHAAAIDHETAVALMRVASRPQRRARGREKAATATARGRRDAVIIALAFCAGLRRSEIAALVWGDITPSARDDGLEVRVRVSKANSRLDEGDSRRLDGEFAQAVNELRRATEPQKTDRVVRLCAHQINHRVQVLADELRLDDVSTHSGRRGLAFELLRSGRSKTAVQAAGGWRSAAMVRHYDWARLRHLAKIK